MPISTRTFRNLGRINSQLEEDGSSGLQSRLDLNGGGLGESGAALDFVLRGRTGAEPSGAGDQTGEGSPTFRVIPDDGGIQVPTTLTRAQIAIIQFNAEDADDPSIAGTQSMDRDSISFVLLAPIGSGTVIYFTDRTWNGTTFSNTGTDGTYTFTAATDMAAGTAITISTAELNAAGINLDSGGLAGSSVGEAIYAYQGAINAPTTFLYAIEVADGNNTFAASLVNTGLTAGVDAIGIGADNGSFAGRTWNIQIPTLLTNIAAATNWVTNENSPQATDVEGTNLFTAPDRQIWVAGSGGGNAIQIVNTDGTHSSNLLGYAIAHLYQNTSVDGNPTTQRFWHPTDVVLDTANDRFFIVDSDGTVDRILQGSISQALSNPGVAPTMTVLYRELPEVSDGSGITGIAIDTANQDIYFTRNQFLMRVDYNTANQTPVTLADLGLDTDTGNPTYANEIALNLATGLVYIVSTESFSDFLPPPAPNGTVGTVMYRNAIIRVSNVAPGDTNATGNTVDRITWTGVYDETNSAATGTPQITEFEDQFGKIISVDVNTLNGDIWFTTVQLNGGANGELGGIYRASIVGTVATVTLVYQETNATNFNFQYIDVDEETGRYYVTSLEPNEANDHSLFSGLLTDVGVQPTFVASLGNINALGPLGLTVQSAPTLAGTGLTPGVTEASSAPASGETAQVALYSGLTAADIDPPTGDELAGAQVRISVNFQSGATHQDFLRIGGNTSGTVAGSGITYSYNSATGVMTLSGLATVAEYAAALQSVTFSTSGDDVTAYGAAGTRTTAASVFDGLLYSDELTATISVTGINDAPVNTNAGADSGAEDTTFNIAGLSVFDVDANPAAAGNQQLTVTLTVTRGTLTLNTGVAGGIVAGDIVGGAQGTATITIQASASEINATFANATGVQFTGGTNVNGTVTLTMVTNDGGFNGNDPGLTGTGTSEQDSDDYTITVTAVNDAPTVSGDGTEDAAPILEDTPLTNLTAPTVATLFGVQFSDAADDQTAFPGGSSPNTFAGIAVITNGSSGATGQWQYWTGAAWLNIGSPGAGSATFVRGDALIRFEPALNYNGNAPTLVAHLVDNSAGSPTTNGASINLIVTPPGGTSPVSNGTVTLSQAITPVNDAPTSTSIAGDSVTYTEQQALAALLDAGSNATIADVDSPNFDTGTLTVAITGGLVAAEDQLVIRLTGTVSFNGTAAFVNGTQIATYTGAGAGGGPLVFTFDADATPAAVAELIRAIAYTNSAGNDPTDGNRTLSWTLVDGDGTANTGQDTLAFTTTVDVDPVNDAPSGADKTIATNEDATYVFTIADFGFTDIDNDNFDGVFFTTVPANGRIFYDADGPGGNGPTIMTAGSFVIGATAAADIAAGRLYYVPNANLNGAGVDSFRFQVHDDGGTLDGGTNIDLTFNTITFNLAAINDAPIVTFAAPTAGSETRVNTFVASTQNDPAVAAFAAGGHVVVWASIQDGGVYGVYAQRYDAAGAPLGSETPVNTTTFNNQLEPDVAALADGSYVVAWSGNGTGDTGGVFMQRYNAAGVAQGGETLVNGVTAGIQSLPSVTALAGGGYVVVWQLNGQDIYGQRFNASGVAQGSEFVVNTVTGGAQQYPSVTGLSGGGFAVTWFSDHEGSGQGVYVRRFDALGVGQGNEVRANTFTAGDQSYSSIGSLQDGGYVVAWESLNQDGSNYGIYAQRYSASGAPVGVEFRVNTSLPNAQEVPTIAGLADGGFVITWRSFAQDGSDYGVYSQRYNAAGATVGVETRINTTTSGAQTNPDVAALPGSGYVVAWSGNGPGDGDGVFNQLQSTAFLATEQVALSLKGRIAVSDVDAGAAVVTATLSVGYGVLNVSVGGSGANILSGNGTGTVVVTGTIAQLNALLNSDATSIVTFTANTDAPPASTALTVTVNDGGATGADPGLTGGAADEQGGATATINILAVNDAPSGADNTVVASEDDPYVFLTTDFGFTDALDNNAFAGVVLTTLPIEGDLRLNGVNITVAGTFITAAQITSGALTFLADPDEFGTAYATFTFQVRDNGGILNGGQDTDQSANTITVNVTADNAPPTLDLDGNDSNTVGTGYTASFTEGGAAVLITDSDVAIADVDVGDMIEGATITINSPVAGDLLTLGAQAAPFVVTGSGTGTITITGTGTAAQYEAMLEQVTFSNGSDDPGTTRTINITVTDGTDTSNIAVATINIAAINDEPTLAATAVNPTFTEGGAAVDLFSGVTADTIEAGQTFVSLTLTVTNVTDGADEILVVGGMNVALTNGNVVATGAGNVTVTLAAGTATVVVGPSTLSEAALQTLIDGLAYLNTSENPTDADRVVTITQLVDSGSDTSPNDATLAPGIASTVNVNPINDTPITTVPGTQTINEDASVTLSTGNGNAIQVADADATTLTVSLTVLHGTLTLASSAGLSFGAGDGTADTTMTFSGTAAAINAALGSGLTYNPNGDFNGSDSIAVFTTDNGQSGGPAQTDSDSITLNITAINDAPVVIGDGTESATTINEDTPGAGQTIQALFAGQYSDAADNQIPNGGASSPGQFSGIAVTANGSSPATGQWQYFSGGVWTDIGAVSDAAAKLLGDPFVTLLRFNPAANYNGPAPTLTVHLIDNSLPFGIVNGQVVDLSGPGATGGTTAYSTGTVVLSQDVTAINDAPLNTVPGTQTINEDASVTLSTGNGNAIQVADADATTVTVNLTVLHGTLTLASIVGLSFGAGDGTADTTMTFSGTAAAINAALGSGLTYNPTPNYNGPDSIAVSTTDNGQTGSGGTQTDNDSVTVNVTPINDQPNIPNSPTVTTDEQVAVTLNAAITVSDVDLDARNGGNGDYSGAAFAINRSVSNAEDVFSFNTAGAQFTVNGSNLESGGNVIATLAQAGGILNINFVNNGTVPTTALVNDVLQHLQYTNTSNEPPASVTLIYIIDDGAPGGGQGALGAPFNNIDGGQVTVNINSVNDAPSGANATITINEDSPRVLSAADFGFSDTVDNDGFAGIVLTTLPTAGILVFDSDGPGGLPGVLAAQGQFVTAAQLALGALTYFPGSNGNGAPYATFTFQVRDDGGTANGGQNTDQSANTITFDVNSVNDAPSGTNGTVTGSEDDPYVFTLADFGFSDAIEGDDFAGVVFTTVPTTGTLFYDADGPGGAAPVALADGAGPIAAADIAAGRVYFVPVTDAFGSPYASFTFQVQDDGGITNGGVDLDPTPNTITINVTPDNLPPAVDLDGATGGVNYVASYTEDAPGVAIGSGVLVTDPNSGTGDMIESATITLTDRVAGDSLTLTGALPPGIIAVTTPTAGAITITITGPGTGAQYQALIESILYSTTSQDPTVGGTDTQRTVTVRVNDGLVDSAVATTTINITPVDDAPVAQPDAFTVNEDMILSGNVFPDNGSGPDSDPDGPPPLMVGAVNGEPTDVGDVVTLPSGAVLTLNADGTFNYLPNNAFDYLPDFVTSGASNTTATDSFTYALVNGNTVTVTVTIRGVDSDGDVLIGTAGADTLNGGIGADTMTGLAGNDTFFVDDAGDVVIEAAGGGDDVVRTSVSYTLAAGTSVETLTTTNQAGIGAIDLTGNETDNRIEGNDGVNVLTGNGGLDRLFGFGGDDTLVGGLGNDQLDGGAGVDTATFAGALTSFADSAIGWIVTSAEGNDVLQNVEIALEGNGQRNLLVGATGYAGVQNALDGAVDDDNVRLATGTYSGAFNYANSGLTVIAQPNAQINATFTPSGTQGITILAANLADTITTGAGGDTIDGGGGNDTMAGGTGDDSYFVDSAGDVVIEAPGAGYDIVYSGTAYVLTAGAAVEVLGTVDNFATTAINLTGNELVNFVTGNAGANTLDGGTGADVLWGRGGNDSYFVDSDDVVVEYVGDGYDIVYARSSHVLQPGFEIEVLGTVDNFAATAINLTGNELGQYVTGNAGANVIDGGAGADYLQGRGGADTFAFTTALGSTNVDLIADFLAGTDKIALDDALFGGIGTPGSFNANAFVIGAAAQDADDRIVYNQATGQLFYDADGNGAGAAVLFGLVAGLPALTVSDFQVI